MTMTRYGISALLIVWSAACTERTSSTSPNDQSLTISWTVRGATRVNPGEDFEIESKAVLSDGNTPAIEPEWTISGPVADRRDSTTQKSIRRLRITDTGIVYIRVVYPASANIARAERDTTLRISWAPAQQIQLTASAFPDEMFAGDTTYISIVAKDSLNQNVRTLPLRWSTNSDSVVAAKVEQDVFVGRLVGVSAGTGIVRIALPSGFSYRPTEIALPIKIMPRCDRSLPVPVYAFAGDNTKLSLKCAQLDDSYVLGRVNISYSVNNSALNAAPAACTAGSGRECYRLNLLVNGVTVMQQYAPSGIVAPAKGTMTFELREPALGYARTGNIDVELQLVHPKQGSESDRPGLLVYGAAVDFYRSPPTTTGVLSITIAPKSVSLLGASAAASLSAVVINGGGLVQNPSVLWSVADTRIASVFGNGPTGMVTSVAVGTTFVRASSGGRTDSIPLTVLPPPRSLTVEIDGNGGGTITSQPTGIACFTGPCTVSFPFDATVTLQATPNTGSVFSGWSGDCSSTNSCTVRMDQTRRVNARFQKTPNAPATVSLTPAKLSIDEGDAAQLTAIVRDAAGNVLPGTVVAWTSSNTAVATVSNAGRVSGISEGDTVEIVASVGAVTASAKVYVSSPFFLATSVDASDVHTCAVRSSQTFCFGSNQYGQLVNPSNSGSGARITTLGLEALMQVAAGGAHTCGISSTGTSYCAGYGSDGRLGDGRGVSSGLPLIVEGNRQFTSLSLGKDNACALTANGSAYCWGNNSSGMLGVGTTARYVMTPSAVVGGLRFAMMVVGGYHQCAVTIGASVYCWGDNYYGQLGDSTSATRSAPIAIRSSLSFTSVGAGYAHTCAIAASRALYCWGNNSDGQLGDGTQLSSKTPRLVAGGLSFKSVSGGDRHTCAITIAEDLYCWGNNENGQLGAGPRSSAFTPTKVQVSEKFTMIAAGSEHNCAIGVARKLYCWGANFRGQLGFTANSGTNVPTLVAKP